MHETFENVNKLIEMSQNQEKLVIVFLHQSETVYICKHVVSRSVFLIRKQFPNL